MSAARRCRIARGAGSGPDERPRRASGRLPDAVLRRSIGGPISRRGETPPLDRQACCVAQVFRRESRPGPETARHCRARRAVVPRQQRGIGIEPVASGCPPGLSNDADPGATRAGLRPKRGGLAGNRWRAVVHGSARLHRDASLGHGPAQRRLWASRRAWSPDGRARGESPGLFSPAPRDLVRPGPLLTGGVPPGLRCHTSRAAVGSRAAPRHRPRAAAGTRPTAAVRRGSPAGSSDEFGSLPAPIGLNH